MNNNLELEKFKKDVLGDLTYLEWLNKLSEYHLEHPLAFPKEQIEISKQILNKLSNNPCEHEDCLDNLNKIASEQIELIAKQCLEITEKGGKIKNAGY